MPLPMKARIKQGLRRQRRNPIAPRELMKQIKLKRADYGAFENAVREMTAAGEVTLKRGRLLLAETVNGKKATIVKVNSTFGFARLEETGVDVFIPGRKMLGALPEDKVLIKTRRASDGRTEGEVIQIVEKTDFRFTGVIVSEKNRLAVMPDKNIRFAIPLERGEVKTEEGQKVLARMVRKGSSHFDYRAVVLAAYGDAQDAKSCSDAILAGAGVPITFPDEVLAQAEELSEKGIHPKELENRLDLRDQPIFTIDSADSKDLDDAVSLEKRENGWELGVHIADVSYYVQPKTALDDEAFERGTSVYYANSVVPMLPQALSNGICSLNPGEDRLAFSALISLDQKGDMTGYTFKKSVIRSRVKGVYAEVNQILDHTAETELLQKYSGLTDTIFKMEELAKLLIAKRNARGGLDLESVESKIIVDEHGVAVDIQPRTRGFSEQIIEEFMLLANEAAATFGTEHQLPFVFRVHDKPSPERVETLKATLEAVGISSQPLNGGATPTGLYKVLQSSKDTPYQKLINNTLLRSMAKAKYSEENIGHFGLVLENYSHFTSPIRRYPDLMIHRIMSSYLSGMRRENIEKRYREFVKTGSLQSSNREVRAMTVERDCEDCYKAEYMKSHLEEVYDGIVGSIAGHGIYVELENTVEGLVRNDKLPQGEYVLSDGMTLTEQHTGKTYRVGDSVKVRVIAVDVSAGNIDFELVTEA